MELYRIGPRLEEVQRPLEHLQLNRNTHMFPSYHCKSLS